MFSAIVGPMQPAHFCHPVTELGDWSTLIIAYLNLKKVLDIFKENHAIELTLIKDKFLADKVKEELISHF